MSDDPWDRYLDQLERLLLEKYCNRMIDERDALQSRCDRLEAALRMIQNEVNHDIIDFIDRNSLVAVREIVSEVLSDGM